MLSLFDSLFALGLATAIVIGSHGRPISATDARGFLTLRVTLLDASASVIFAVLWAKCFEFAGLYRSSYRRLATALIAAALSCLLMTVVLGCYLALRTHERSVGTIAIRFFVVALCYETVRIVILSRMRLRSADGMVRTVILGSGRRASKAWRELRIKHSKTHQFLGFIDDLDPFEMPPDMKANYLTDVDHLADFLIRNVVDELIVAVPSRSCYEMAQRAVEIAESAGVRVSCLQDIYALWHSTNLRSRAEPFFELVPHDRTHHLSHGCKRMLDFTLALFGLICLAPLFLLLAIAVKATSKGPVFFVQDRHGYRRRRFRMYKFRSMVHNAPELMAGLEHQNEASGPVFKIKNDPRVTAIGKLLRTSSLDELPQLWNVLRGDMSLVGPRPMSVRDVSLFDNATLMRRFSVRPGITGIWQVSGRSALSFEQWIRLDFQYIEDWSLELDLMILVRTVRALLKRTGAV